MIFLNWCFEYNLCAYVLLVFLLVEKNLAKSPQVLFVSKCRDKKIKQACFYQVLQCFILLRDDNVNLTKSSLCAFSISQLMDRIWLITQDVTASNVFKEYESDL